MADPRNCETKCKPQIVPPRRHGGSSGSGQGIGCNYPVNNNNNSSGYGSQTGGSQGGYRNRNDNNRDKDRETTNYRAEYNRFHNRGRGRGRFNKSPTVRRPRIASQTPNKDNIRCFYCKEHRHIIRHCLPRLEEEESEEKVLP